MTLREPRAHLECLGFIAFTANERSTPLIKVVDHTDALRLQRRTCTATAAQLSIRHVSDRFKCKPHPTAFDRHKVIQQNGTAVLHNISCRCRLTEIQHAGFHY